MYLGPLRWPPLWIWAALLVAWALISILVLLGLDATIATIIVVVIVLVIAAPRRVRDLGADELRDSRPDE